MRYEILSPQTSHLRRSNQGCWTLVIPKNELKNGEKNKDLRMVDQIVFPLGEIEVISDHIKMIDLYIERFRPLINETNSLFINSTGKNITRSDISNGIKRFSEKYLSKFSIFDTGLNAVEPFRSHVIRTIVATHYIKIGRLDLAVILLLDDQETIKKHYIVDTIDHKLQRACRNMTRASLGL